MGRRFPRIRGDVPLGGKFSITDEAFSPHTRGCSGHDKANPVRIRVFPAYAGMFRLRCGLYPARSSFPRIRGDIPKHSGWGHDYFVFSPHTRGCSAAANGDSPWVGVFPAYAGMFRP